MSGICGLWTAKPSAERPSCAVQAGLEAMEHRGRDGFSIYPDRNVVLGHCLFDTGCNGMVVDEDGFAISFDGRLDNRDALIGALRHEDVEPPLDFDRLTDKALLLHAYRLFGTELPAMLRGDFALAIWNPESRALFLCRDHLGVRPLFYRWQGDAFHFASEIKGLRAMAGYPRLVVRDRAIQGFVNGKLDASEPERTFYQDVFRLLPAHYAVIGPDGMETVRYWTLDPGLPQRRPDNGARFRAALIQAVDRRLRGTVPVAALLSGGIDSSAIVSLIGARETRVAPGSVKVFSMTFAEKLAEDETPYIDAVVERYPLDSVKLEQSGVSAFHQVDEIIGEQDHPPPAPNASTFRSFLHDLARHSGARVVLDGHGGDQVASYGMGLFKELAENGQWIALWKALGESEELLGPRRRHFRKLVLRGRLRSWRRAIVRQLWPNRPRPQDPARFTADGICRPAEQAQHIAKLTSPLFSLALEFTDHNAAATGVEVRMPFLDVDLISFCVTVPADEKWARGYPRALVRDALENVLPPLVAQRRGKFDFSGHVLPSMVADHAALVEETLFAKGGWIAPYADLADLRAKWRALREAESLEGLDFMEIWRAVVLSRWLQLESASSRRVERPVLAAAE